MKERFISAIVALLITVPLILLGNMYFNTLVIVLGLIAMYELLKPKKNIPKTMRYISYVLFVMFLIFGYTFTGSIYIMNFTLLILAFMVMFLSLLYYHDNKKYCIDDVFYLLGSIIFLSAAFNLFIVIRNEGLLITLYLFLITTMTDTFAYIIGSKIGKKKLLPTVSPKKSIEGFIGGLICGSFIASIFYILCISGDNIINVIFVSIILSIIGQCGDLVFSQIKRHFGIKDYSNIMPGHGGVLDRLDSIIFVLFGYIILITLI